MTYDLGRLAVVNASYVGIGVAVLAVTGLVRSWASLVAWSALAPLLGMATAGVAMSTLALVGVSVHATLVALVLVGLVLGVGAVVRRRTAVPARRPERPLWLLPALALMVAALPAFLVRPLVDWDAWAIWGLKAKALAELGAVEGSFFANPAYAGSQVDYPLLIPALEAAVWPGVAAPAILVHLQMWLLGTAAVLALWSVLTLRAPRRMVGLALMVLVASPAFTTELMRGYADVPLAVFSAAGLALLAGWLVRPEPALLPLATLFLAAAVLTKNEGMLLVLAVALALLAAGLATRRLRAALPGVVAIVVAAAAALPWQLYVARHDLRTGLYETSVFFDPAELAERSDRLGPSTSALVEALLNPLQWSLAAPLFVAVGVLAYLAGARRTAVFGGAWAVVLVGELLLAYWIANTPLEWHLLTSVDRVVAPLAVGMVALAPLLAAERPGRPVRHDARPTNPSIG